MTTSRRRIESKEEETTATMDVVVDESNHLRDVPVQARKEVINTEQEESGGGNEEENMEVEGTGAPSLTSPRETDEETMAVDGDDTDSSDGEVGSCCRYHRKWRGFSNTNYGHCSGAKPGDQDAGGSNGR